MSKADENRSITSTLQNSSKITNEVITTVNCLVIGDAGIGKSSLVRSFILSDGLGSRKYMPTTYQEYSVHNQMKDVFASETQLKCRLKIIDTGGQSKMDRLRPLFYNKADVIILCFSVVKPLSFQNILKRWLPELKLYGNGKEIILVGTHSDLRFDTKVLLHLAGKNMAPVPEYKIKNLSRKIGAKYYIECSSLSSNSKVDEIFNYSMMCGFYNQIQQRKENDRAKKTVSESKILQLLSKEWVTRSCSTLKKLMFLSCTFN